MFRECCWRLSKRGAVGETGLHVCFLIPTSTHIELAKRMIKRFPKVTNKTLHIFAVLIAFNFNPTIFDPDIWFFKL